MGYDVDDRPQHLLENNEAVMDLDDSDLAAKKETHIVDND